MVVEEEAKMKQGSSAVRLTECRFWAVFAMLIITACAGALGQGNSSPDWHDVRIGDVCLSVPSDWYDYTPAAREGPDDDGVMTVALWMSNSAEDDAAHDTVGLHVLSMEDPLFLEILRDLDGDDDFERIDEYEALFAGRAGLWTLYHVTNLHDVPGLEGRMWFVNQMEPQADGTFLLFVGVEPVDTAASESVIRSILLSAAACVEEDQPTCTVTVQPGESIQAAIDAAPEGALICLAKGEWQEHLTIEKSLSLRGTEDGSTIRGHEETIPVIRVHSHGGDEVVVILDGMSVTGGRGELQGHGVHVEGSAKLSIEHSAIEDNDASGIAGEGSSRTTVTSSTLARNGRSGISILSSAAATICTSTITSNGGSGVVVKSAARATISSSVIKRNGWGGILVEDSAWATIEDATIQANRWMNILIGGLSRASITGCIVSESYIGIWLSGTSHTTIQNNIVFGNEFYGVSLWEHPCSDVPFLFLGYVSGFGNTIAGPQEEDGNAEGAVCPEELAFLMTEEGGELDRREEE